METGRYKAAVLSSSFPQAVFVENLQARQVFDSGLQKFTGLVAYFFCEHLARALRYPGVGGLCAHDFGTRS